MSEAETGVPELDDDAVVDQVGVRELSILTLGYYDRKTKRRVPGALDVLAKAVESISRLEARVNRGDAIILRLVGIIVLLQFLGIHTLLDLARVVGVKF